MPLLGGLETLDPIAQTFDRVFARGVFWCAQIAQVQSLPDLIHILDTNHCLSFQGFIWKESCRCVGGSRDSFG